MRVRVKSVSELTDNLTDLVTTAIIYSNAIKAVYPDQLKNGQFFIAWNYNFYARVMSREQQLYSFAPFELQIFYLMLSKLLAKIMSLE